MVGPMGSILTVLRQTAILSASLPVGTCEPPECARGQGRLRPPRAVIDDGKEVVKCVQFFKTYCNDLPRGKCARLGPVDQTPRQENVDLSFGQIVTRGKAAAGCRIIDRDPPLCAQLLVKMREPQNVTLF
jgi:hypothetical protein